MTFKQAVKHLGGPLEVSRLTGVARTVIIYWLEHGVSRFRQNEAEKIIALAEQDKREIASGMKAR
jgi:hypothetical protein